LINALLGLVVYITHSRIDTIVHTVTIDRAVVLSLFLSFSLHLSYSFQCSMAEFGSIEAWAKARDPVVKHLYRLRTNASDGKEDIQVRLMSTGYTLFGSAMFVLSMMLFAGYIFYDSVNQASLNRTLTLTRTLTLILTQTPSVNEVSTESLSAAHLLPDMAITINMAHVTEGSSLKYFWPVLA